MLDLKHSGMQFSGIYQIVNTVSNKSYIGSSKNIYHRVKRHLSDLRRNSHANPKLQSSFNKHGEEVFETIILERVAPGALLSREEHWFNRLSPVLNCMSIFNERPVLTLEMRQRISIATKFSIKEGRTLCGAKPLDVFNLKGVKIATYPSYKSAVKTLGVSIDGIERVIKGSHGQWKGYMFRLVSDNVVSLPPFKARDYTDQATKMHKSCTAENILTGEITTYNSFKEMKKVYGISIIHNIKYGVVYKKQFLFYYAT